MTSSPQFRAVILDYGRVLCHSPQEAHIQRIADVFGWNLQQFWAAFEIHRPAYDRGQVTCAEFWRSMINGTGVTPSPKTLAQLPQWDIDMWLCIDESMMRWVESLRGAGYKTALLSNAPLEFAQYARREFAWIKKLDCCVFSAEIHLAKPDAAIYEHCLNQLGIAPHEALFIDDVQANVEGARAAGLSAVQFKSVEQLAGELKDLGFPQLPGSV